MGMVAAGIEEDLESASDRRVKVASQVDSEPASRKRLDDLYEVYLETYEALEPVFPRLAGR